MFSLFVLADRFKNSRNIPILRPGPPPTAYANRKTGAQPNHWRDREFVRERCGSENPAWPNRRQDRRPFDPGGPISDGAEEPPERSNFAVWASVQFGALPKQVFDAGEALVDSIEPP